MFHKIAIITFGTLMPLALTLLITRATGSSDLGWAAGISLLALIFTIGAVGEMLLNAIKKIKEKD